MNGDDMKRVKVENKQVANQFSIHNICKTRDICTLIFKQILLCFDFVFWSVLFLRSMLWLVESKAEFYYVEVYFGIIVGVMAFVTFGHKLFDIYIEPRMKLRVNHDVSKIFLEKIITSKMEYLEQKEHYDKFVKIENLSISRVYEFMERIAFFVGHMITSLLVVFILGSIDFKSIFVLIIPIVGNVFVQKKYFDLKYISECEYEKSNVGKEYVKRCFYSKEYAGEMRTSKIYKSLLASYDEATHKAVGTHVKFGRRRVILSFGTELLKNRIPFSLIFFYAVYCVMIQKNVSVIDISVILIGLVNLSDRIGVLINAISDVRESKKHVDDFLDFLNTEIKESTGLRCLKKELNQSIAIRNVSFAYPGEKMVLQDISFTLNKGEKIAIVGENGSGKTTLLKLLLRLYTPVKGNIYIDDINVQSLDIYQYRELFSVVQQESKLFAFSIGENIACNKVYDRQTVLKCLTLTGLDTKIGKLEHSVEAMVSKEFDECGENFSGGEERKILIARALMREGSIGIFDEPIAALDPFAEEKLMKVLFEFPGLDTSIFVLHQLAYAKYVDKIIVLDNGKIIEQGNHNELMKNKGKYYLMYTRQAECYLEQTIGE